MDILTGGIGMAQKYEQLLLKNQLCFPLYACSRKIVGSYTPYLKQLGLTYTTPLLKRLEKAGYVTRERSKEDERVTVISITPEGDSLKEKCKDIPMKMSSKGSLLTEKDAKELYRLLYMFLDGE